MAAFSSIVDTYLFVQEGVNFIWKDGCIENQKSMTFPEYYYNIQNRDAVKQKKIVNALSMRQKKQFFIIGGWFN